MRVTSVLALSLSIAANVLHATPTNINPQKPPIVAKTTKSTKINLNKADVATLLHSFKGIGKKRAQAIVQYRQSHQQFKAIEELSLVKGFGKAFVEKHLSQLKEVFCVS